MLSTHIRSDEFMDDLFVHSNICEGVVYPIRLVRVKYPCF